MTRIDNLIFSDFFMVFLFKPSSYRKLDNLLNKLMVYFYLVQRYFIEYFQRIIELLKHTSFSSFY